MNVKNQDIAKSEFEDVNLDSATFTNVNLGSAKFENINLSKSKFHDINFSDVEFTAAQIGGALFKHIGPPPDKDGKQARQRPVTFEEAMLCDSIFRKVDLSNVQVVDCDIKGMTINGILVTEMIDMYNAHKR